MHKILVMILEDMGYCIIENESDFDIRDYILDSIQFMDFIVRIEEKLEIELSDDFLNYELLFSAIALANKIESYIEEVNQLKEIPPLIS